MFCLNQPTKYLYAYYIYICILFCQHNHVNSKLTKTVNTSNSNRIVGGSNVTNEFLYPFYIKTNNVNEFCGGTLIHKDIVLTAAHCGQSDVEVCLGGTTLDCSNSRNTYRITQIYKHPLYASTFKVKNDIMLLKINQSAPEPYVQLNYNRKIPNTRTTTFDIENTTVVTSIGYGITSQDGTVSDVLLQVNINVVNYTYCRQYYKNKYNLKVADNVKVVCAGTATGGKDTCYGDSGGPLLLKTSSTNPNEQIQIGIISYGDFEGCAIANAPGVYTRISNYKKWITNTICNVSNYPPDTCTPIV